MDQAGPSASWAWELGLATEVGAKFINELLADPIEGVSPLSLELAGFESVGSADVPEDAQLRAELGVDVVRRYRLAVQTRKKIAPHPG